MSLLDFWGLQLPSAKRRKTTDRRTTASPKPKLVQGYRNSGGPEYLLLTSNVPCGRDIEDERHDKVGVSGKENVAPDSRTELEDSLPEIKTNGQSVEDHYWAERQQDEDQHLDRQKGPKSSIYVDAFNLALETVLSDEGHLFDEAEMDVFRQWRNLSYEAQYLCVPLSPSALC